MAGQTIAKKEYPSGRVFQVVIYDLLDEPSERPESGLKTIRLALFKGPVADAVSSELS